jgi:hypothetical protein
LYAFGSFLISVPTGEDRFCSTLRRALASQVYFWSDSNQRENWKTGLIFVPTAAIVVPLGSTHRAGRPAPNPRSPQRMGKSVRLKN